MVEVFSVEDIHGKTIKKLTELTPKCIILEKVGSNGELKIMPRIFADQKKAVDYLATVEDTRKHSTHIFKKKVEYYIVPATFVEFLT